MNRKKPSISWACSWAVGGVYRSHLEEPSSIRRVAILCRGSRNIRNLQYFNAWKKKSAVGRVIIFSFPLLCSPRPEQSLYLPWCICNDPSNSNYNSRVFPSWRKPTILRTCRDEVRENGSDNEYWMAGKDVWNKQTIQHTLASSFTYVKK